MVVLSVDGTPIIARMFYLMDEKIIPRLFFDHEIDQPPTTILWLLEAVIRLLQWLGHRKSVIS
jgi:hypothetical protein